MTTSIRSLPGRPSLGDNVMILSGANAYQHGILVGTRRWLIWSTFIIDIGHTWVESASWRVVKVVITRGPSHGE